MPGVSENCFGFQPLAIHSHCPADTCFALFAKSCSASERL